MTKRKKHNLPMRVIGVVFNLLEDGIVDTLNAFSPSSDRKQMAMAIIAVDGGT